MLVVVHTRLVAPLLAVLVAAGSTSASAAAVRPRSARAEPSTAPSRSLARSQPAMRPGAVPGAEVLYEAPVPQPLQVLRGFSAPATRYGPGHLGVDLAVRPGSTVRAAAAGTVTFAGPVAGRGVVVIRHADGISTEYEPVRPLVRAAQPLARGDVIGVIDGHHHGCAPGRCLHWGARRDGVYLDPLTLLRPLGPVRLLPWR